MSHYAVVVVSRITQKYDRRLRPAPLVLQNCEQRAGVAISMPPHPPFPITLYDGGGGGPLLPTPAGNSRAEGGQAQGFLFYLFCIIYAP
jgi:hypothetical protein